MDHLTIERQALLLVQILDVQQRILARLDDMVQPSTLNDWYSPSEIALLVDRKPATIRSWCRTGKITARKRTTGRANKLDWEISRDELQRLKNHGLRRSPEKEM